MLEAINQVSPESWDIRGFPCADKSNSELLAKLKTECLAKSHDFKKNTSINSNWYFVVSICNPSDSRKIEKEGKG